MVHFDFTVDDRDAEMIFGCIHDRICNMRERIFFDSMSMEKSTSEVDIKHYTAQIEWYKSHIKYIEGLIEKMIKGRSQ